MTDPFRDNPGQSQWVREAKVGLLIVAMSLIFLSYIVYRQTDRFKSRLPRHVLEAPVAIQLGPDDYNRVDRNAISRDGAIPESPLRDSAASDPPTQPGKTTSEKSLVSQLVTALWPENGARPSRMPVSSVPPLATALSRDDQPAPILIERSDNPASKKNSYDLANELGPGFESEQQIQLASFEADDDVANCNAANEEITDVGAVNDEDVPGSAANEVIPNHSSGVPGSWETISEMSESDSKLESEFLATANAMESVSNDFQPHSNSNDSTLMARQATTIQRPNFDLESVDHSPAPTSLTQHTIGAGESYWLISQKYYDDGRLFRALYQHNRGEQTDFESLEVGAKLTIPSLDELVYLYPDLCPSDLLESRTLDTGDDSNITDRVRVNGTFYLTQRGDTLFDIARRQLGQASRYLEILQINRGQLPSHIDHLSRLKEGLRLRLPN